MVRQFDGTVIEVEISKWGMPFWAACVVVTDLMKEGYQVTIGYFLGLFGNGTAVNAYPFFEQYYDYFPEGDVSFE